MLTMIAQPSPEPAPAAAPEVLLRPTGLPPAAELSGLPASFTGTLVCDDCPGIRYELSLFGDDSFFLRTTRLAPRGGSAVPPVDTLGSWVRSSDRRAIILEGRGGVREMFGVQDNRTLRKLDANGQPVASVGLRDLRRATRFSPLDLRAAMTGVYRVEGTEAQFIECSTGQRWTVAETGGGPASTLRAAAEREGARAGNAVFASIEGRVAQRRVPAAEAAAQGTSPGLVLDVDKVEGTAIGKSCAPRFGSVPLENTSWRLTRLGTTPIAPGAPADPTVRQLGLIFRDESRSFGGNGGCNRVAGAYETDGEALLLKSVGTMRACATVTDRETTFRTALVNARSYRILGRTLELFSADRQALARFEAVD
jgi:copper homeostasis protein (lipoprotein)